MKYRILNIKNIYRKPELYNELFVYKKLNRPVLETLNLAGTSISLAFYPSIKSNHIKKNH